MELKRLSHEELIPLCKEIFYDYLSNEGGLFWYSPNFGTLESDCPTPAHQVHKQYEELLKQNEERQRVYNNALSYDGLDDSCKKSLNKQIEFLKNEHNALITSNLENQKELYERTHIIDYTRTCVRIPLDKIINSYYDDLTLEVVYYDDVSTLNGKFEEYKELNTKEDRLKFIKAHTEITHLGLAVIREGSHKATIGLLGELNLGDPRLSVLSYEVLPHKFSDFTTLTLKDTNEIENNDLKQFIQSKIDLDKEDLKKLSSQMVRGDLYEIYQDPENTDDYYIRYICRSTGRVYYNPLNLRNLKLSDYYKEENIDTWALAWWNLNTLGEKPEGEPIVRL